MSKNEYKKDETSKAESNTTRTTQLRAMEIKSLHYTFSIWALSRQPPVYQNQTELNTCLGHGYPKRPQKETTIHWAPNPKEMCIFPQEPWHLIPVHKNSGYQGAVRRNSPSRGSTEHLLIVRMNFQRLDAKEI